MPALPRAILTDRLLQAFEVSGAAADLLSAHTANPRKVLLHTQRAPVRVFVYLWTATSGGRTSLPNEYRIQMTSVRSPIPRNMAGPTLLMGYEPDLNAFAGFDVSRHRVFTEGSPSVQIEIGVLRRAVTDGLSVERKSNGEVVCGIRPDHLLGYVSSSPQIHRFGKRVSQYSVLQRAVEGSDVSQADMQGLSKPRKRALKEVSQWTRDTRFRHLVLQAYDNRCAVTGMQMRLVDAAHILPVGAPGSTDEITNGIAISPTYHRAYDRGLIFLDDHYRLRINQEKLAVLKSLSLLGGLKTFRQYTGRRILLPSNPSLRPSVRYILKANAFRGLAR